MDEEGLRAKQLETTRTLLAARPVDGFPTAELSDPFSFEGYVARQIFWHMRGALGEGEAPPDAWLTHEDGVVLQQVALAVGHDALVALTDSAGDGQRDHLVGCVARDQPTLSNPTLPNTPLSDLQLSNPPLSNLPLTKLLYPISNLPLTLT